MCTYCTVNTVLLSISCECATCTVFFKHVYLINSMLIPCYTTKYVCFCCFQNSKAILKRGYFKYYYHIIVLFMRFEANILKLCNIGFLCSIICTILRTQLNLGILFLKVDKMFILYRFLVYNFLLYNFCLMK